MYKVFRCCAILIFLYPLSSYSEQPSIQDSLDNITNYKTLEWEYPAYSVLFINDNYIATWLPGEDGHYFGADDFLTSSLIANIYWKNWQHNLTYNTLTLRKYNLRYDLLSVLSSYNLRFTNFSLSGGLGLMYKGELNGDFFQNGYHKFRAIKRVQIPYSNNKGLGIIFSVNVNWHKDKIVLSKDIFRLAIESKIYTDHVASRISPKISYQAGFLENKLQAEVLMAYRTYLNQVKNYSNMVRPGIVYGVNLKTNVYKDYFVDIGFITIPTRNIESDPKYPKYKNNYLPQAWIGFSWNTDWYSIIDYIAY